MSMTVEQYRKKHRRCRTCVFAYQYKFSQDGWRCAAKGDEHGGLVGDGAYRVKGMFCRLYQPKEGQ